MMRGNTRQGPVASFGVPAPVKASAAMGDDGKTSAGGCDGATEAQAQAQAIICAAKRAVEEEAKRGEADVGRLSVKKSLEWFLARRKKKTTAAGPVHSHRHRHEESSSSSSN